MNTLKKYWFLGVLGIGVIATIILGLGKPDTQVSVEPLSGASVLTKNQGGTGLSSYTAGDMIWASSSNQFFQKTGIGSTGQCWEVIQSGRLGWGVCSGGGGGGSAIGMREGFSAAFANKTSISFDQGGFILNTANTDARLFIDYANGPASRSATQTISGAWTFSTAPTLAGAAFTGSISTNFDPSTNNTKKLGDIGNTWITGYFGTSLCVACGGTLNTVLEAGGTASISGATTLGSTLGVTGATTLSSTLSVTGRSDFSSHASISGTLDVTGNLKAAGYASASQTFGSGLSNCLTTSFLQWTAATGKFSCAAGTGLVGGSDTQVQFNDSGSFGGDSGLTYNKTTDVLTMGTTTFQDGAIAAGGSSDLALSTVSGDILLTGGVDISIEAVQNVQINAGTALVVGADTTINNDLLVKNVSISFNLEVANRASVSKLFDGRRWTVAAGTPNSVCENSATGEITINAALTCTVSARDQKTHIDDFFSSNLIGGFNMTEALELVAKLKPRQFAYVDYPERMRWGFVADEVQAVDPKLGDAIDAKGNARSIDIAGIIALNTKAIQELNMKVDAIDGVAPYPTQSSHGNYGLFGLLGLLGLFPYLKKNKSNK